MSKQARQPTLHLHPQRRKRSGLAQENPISSGVKTEFGALGFCGGGSAFTSWELHVLYKPDGVGITPWGLKHRQHTLRVAHLGHPEEKQEQIVDY